MPEFRLTVVRLHYFVTIWMVGIVSLWHCRIIALIKLSWSIFSGIFNRISRCVWMKWFQQGFSVDFLITAETSYTDPPHWNKVLVSMPHFTMKLHVEKSQSMSYILWPLRIYESHGCEPVGSLNHCTAGLVVLYTLLQLIPKYALSRKIVLCVWNL